jgi:hypothetical protein
VQEGPYLFPHWTGSCEKWKNIQSPQPILSRHSFAETEESQVNNSEDCTSTLSHRSADRTKLYCPCTSARVLKPWSQRQENNTHRCKPSLFSKMKSV